jgi:hypothetical protein
VFQETTITNGDIGRGGREIRDRDKRGVDASRAPGLFFFVIFYYYTNEYLQIRMVTTRPLALF